MIKIDILKQDIVTNSATFPTLEEGQEWLSRHEGMGTFGADYEVVITDITEKVEQERKNAVALKLLADTDWYVIRKQETGIEIPEDISAARTAARLAIVK